MGFRQTDGSCNMAMAHLKLRLWLTKSKSTMTYIELIPKHVVKGD